MLATGLVVLLLVCPACRGETILQKLAQLGHELNSLGESLDSAKGLVTDLSVQIGKQDEAGVSKDCSDPSYQSQPSGVRVIRPDGQTPITVYCDQDTDGGGWTVFQRRKDGSVDFYRTWAEYQDGFGNLTGEFWLGLDYLHVLTSNGRYQLRVDMALGNGSRAVATYNNFNVDGSPNKYQLHLGPFTGGNAGDSLPMHNGMYFSTKDADNDPTTDHCAQLYHGAFWYNNCHKANPNGSYNKDGKNPFGAGITWHTYTGYDNSLYFVEMKLRPNV